MYSSISCISIIMADRDILHFLVDCQINHSFRLILISLYDLASFNFERQSRSDSIISGDHGDVVGRTSQSIASLKVHFLETSTTIMSAPHPVPVDRLTESISIMIDYRHSTFIPITQHTPLIPTLSISPQSSCL